MIENQTSFFARAPFAQQRSYLIWLKVTAILIGLLTLSLLGFSLKDYLAYQDLLVQKNSLAGSVAQLDEIVRKKNKLLSEDGQKDKYHNQKLYAKIAQYLVEIESALVPGLHLSSFEYTANKLEISGYSEDLDSLITTVANLQKLSFVKEQDLQQVGMDVKVSNHKLTFTIVINL